MRASNALGRGAADVCWQAIFQEIRWNLANDLRHAVRIARVARLPSNSRQRVGLVQRCRVCSLIKKAAHPKVCGFESCDPQLAYASASSEVVADAQAEVVLGTGLV